VSLPKPGQAASVRGQSNHVLSEVLRAGRASTTGLSPLSTPDSILICYQKLSDAWGTRKRLIPLPPVRVCVVLGRATIDEVALSLLHVPSRRG
jgi:hypothetical protein